MIMRIVILIILVLEYEVKFMIKKLLLLILMGSILLCTTACTKDDEAKSGDLDSAELKTTGAATKNTTESSEGALNVTGSSTAPALTSSVAPSQKSVETFVKTLITQGYANSKVDSLTVFEARNTPEEGDYKVHVTVSWSGTNSPEDSRTTLEGYSNNIAAMINANLENVAELSIIWLAPNIDGSGTAKYKKLDGLLSLYDISFDSNFGTSSTTTDGAVDTEDTMGEDGVMDAEITVN